MKPQTQTARLAKLLKRGWTSPMDALRVVGTFKLSTRVGELRRNGHQIQDKWAAGRAYKIYRIVKECV